MDNFQATYYCRIIDDRFVYCHQCFLMSEDDETAKTEGVAAIESWVDWINKTSPGDPPKTPENYRFQLFRLTPVERS